ncbi:MAG: YicC family protein [Oscillospiraceae bacterium]|nr:YicC family protein [Oscillospiraceae bacterium]
MPKSMTGYGRASKSFDTYEITVEVRSVNHRFFEFSTRISRQYSFLEDKLKSLFASKINRGKVETYVSINRINGSDCVVEVNAELANNYVSALRNANEQLGLKDDLTLSQLFRMSDVFTVSKSEIDEDELWSLVSETANEALDSFIAMRTAEGERLKDDILSKLDFIEDTVTQIETRSPDVTKEYRTKLYTRLCDILGDKNIDESRILTEAAIFADKTAVDEETVRLRSHIAQYRELLQLNEPIGKKLDFLVQEMNREVNTTGSKCSDLTITRMVVDLKSTIEKIREQIQNIE